MKYVSIALLLFVVSFASAQPRMRWGGHMPQGGGRERIAEKLNLTEDEQKQFDKLSSDLEKKQIALRSRIQTARVELRDLIRSDSPDQAKIEAKQSEISKLETDLKLNRTGFWFDVNKILTPEQQKEWKKVLEMPMPGMRGENGWRGKNSFGPGAPQHRRSQE